MIKRILVNYTGRTGGGALYSYEMTKGFVDNGIEVYAVISKQCDNVDEWKKLALKKLILIDTYTNKIEFLYKSIFFFKNNKQTILKALSGVDIDAVYVPMISYWTYFINSLFPNAIKIITIHDPIHHSGERAFNKLFYNKTKSYIEKADYIVVLSNVFINYVSKEYRKARDRIILVPHGIFDFYKTKQINDDCLNVNYDEKKVNFCFFGRIEKYKGIDVLLKAYKKLELEFPNKVSLTIAGNGDFTSYEGSFKNLKSAYLINRWIKDEEVNRLFVGSNVVTVLPYLDATQSGVTNIAMLNKSLIIASDAGGLKEQIDGGRLGLLVKAGDEEELYKTMKSIVINGYEKYSPICESAYSFVKSLSWNNLASIILNSVR